jgi:fructokinase
MWGPMMIRSVMRIGIDLGGTKIEGVLLGDDGAERARERGPTPHSDYQAVLEAIAALVTRLDACASGAGAPGTGPKSPTIGVATPGFLSPGDGVIRNSNLTLLNGRPVDRDLAARLGRPVRLENDANCFVLSEATDGAAAPRPGEAARGDVIFGATLGTGIGGGLVVDGKVWGGANGSAGEWSHTTLPFLRPDDGPGSGCALCDHAACIESFLSGRGLTWDYERNYGKPLSAVEIAQQAADGSPDATGTFERYEDRLARALAGVVNLIDPRVIVLGGGISNNVRIFEKVPLLWERYTVARHLATRLVRASHGDASGVRGAACLWE